jgi:hypothetical protein
VKYGACGVGENRGPCGYLIISIWIAPGAAFVIKGGWVAIASYINPLVWENGLTAVQAAVTSLFLCTSQPATYTDAHVAFHCPAPQG